MDWVAGGRSDATRGGMVQGSRVLNLPICEIRNVEDARDYWQLKATNLVCRDSGRCLPWHHDGTCRCQNAATDIEA